MSCVYKKQNFEEKNALILKKFNELRDKAPEKLKEPLKLSWSNWGFGMESLEDSCARLSGVGLKYIELHGNHYGILKKQVRDGCSYRSCHCSYKVDYSI